MKKGVAIMSISKDDLCDSCREIRPLNEYTGKLNSSTLGEDLDNYSKSKSTYRVIWLALKENGGCPDCIALLQRAVL